MKTKIGIGHSNQTDSFSAGKEAASRAVEQGKIERADFALIFCGGKHNPNQFLNGVNEVIPACQKAGGTSFGIISDTLIGYDGFEVGVTVFSSDKIKFTVFSQGELNLDEAKAGERLGKQIQEANIVDARGLMVFFDSSKQQNPPMLNFATPLFAGLAPYLPSGISCVGGGWPTIRTAKPWSCLSSSTHCRFPI